MGDDGRRTGDTFENGHHFINGSSSASAAPPPSSSSPSSSSSSSLSAFLPSLSSSAVLVSSLLFLWLTLDPHRRPRHLRSMLTFGPSAIVNEVPHLLLPLVSVPVIALLSRQLFAASSAPFSSPSSMAWAVSLLSQSLSAISLLTLFLSGLRSRQSFRRALLHPASLSPAAVEVLRTPAPRSTSTATSPPPLLNPLAAGEQGEPIGGSVVKVDGADAQLSAEQREQVERVGAMTAFRWTQTMLPPPALSRWKEGVRVDRGLVFHAVGGGGKRMQHLRLDVYHPPTSPLLSDAASTEPLFPLVIYVHGGGWITGDKAHTSLPLLAHLAQSGIVVATVNYRLAPNARHPSAVIDVKRAIHFLRTHAGELHADPALFFLAGDSAGGHIAALAALTAGRAEYQPGFEGRDTSVLGVVDLYGIHSFIRSKRGERTKQEDGFMAFLAHYVMSATADDRPELYEAASPIWYLQANDRTRPGSAGGAGTQRSPVPWFFCAHGHMDTLVPVEDTLRFFSALLELRQREARAGFRGPPLDVCVDVKGASHAFNLVYTPRSYALGDAVVLWIRRVLEREGRQPRPGTTPPNVAREWIQQRSRKVNLQSSL